MNQSETKWRKEKDKVVAIAKKSPQWYDAIDFVVTEVDISQNILTNKLMVSFQSETKESDGRFFECRGNFLPSKIYVFIQIDDFPS